MKILIVAYLDEKKEFQRVRPDLKFDLVVNNHPSALDRLSKVRLKGRNLTVYLSPDVARQGVYDELFDKLYMHCIMSAIDPIEVFKVL